MSTTTNANSLLACIDIGANLTNKRFRHDLEDVLKTSTAAGVEKIVLTGTSEADSRKASDICQTYSGCLFSTAGIHPHHASEFDRELTPARLSALCELDHVVAVGECGLDFNRDFSPRDAQRDCFQAHLDLAAQNGMPMFLHERDAFDEFIATMRDNRNQISRAVVHCFTGSLENARAYLDLDLHLGITGWICDPKRGSHLREVVKQIPANRLMIETDCPYLAPKDVRPKINRNEPRHLPHILRTVAECRNQSAEELSAQIMKTTKDFFGI